MRVNSWGIKAINTALILRPLDTNNYSQVFLLTLSLHLLQLQHQELEEPLA